MPNYAFDCEHCGAFNFDAPVMDAGPCDCPVCGSQDCVKVFSPTTAICIPAHMTAANSAGQSAHKEWANSPEVKRKRDMGLIAPVDEADLVSRQIAQPVKTKTADEIYQECVQRGGLPA